MKSKSLKSTAKCLAVLATITTTLWTTHTAQAASSSLVIAEAYGGGGNSGATYKNDYVVVFNLSGNNVDVQGWSVQYASSAGTTWQVTPLSTTSKIIPPGGYFLVQEAAGSGGTTDLPTPDATGSINMSGTQFKLALCNSVTALTGSNPSDSSIIDFVGFGSANASETSPAPVLSNTTSGQRANSGCTDTDNNSADFTTGSPNPRNSSSPTHSCVEDVQPIISDISPSSITSPAGATVSFTVTLSQGSGQYYWSKIKNDVTNAIPSASGPTLSLQNVLGTDSAGYQVVVSNSVGTATSTVVTLTVIDPGIITQPFGGTRLLNSVFTPTVIAGGTEPLVYRWYIKPSSDNSDFTGAALLANSAHILAADTAGLIVTNLTFADATNYFVVVSNSFGSVTSSVVTLSVANSGRLVFWDFNGTINTNNPVPAYGPGNAARVGISSTYEPLSGTGIPDALDNANANAEGLTNAAWGTSGYPSQGSSNKLGGVQFNVNTVGFKNITLAYDIRATAAASKYQRLQYTTNGTDFVDFPTTTTPLLQSSDANGFIPRVDNDNDLTGFPGVANNPNFGIRIVTEWESSANGDFSGTPNFVNLSGSSSGYSTSATLTYDRVAISAVAITNGNAAPTISGFTNAATSESVSNLIVLDTGAATNILFQVGDDSPVANLAVNVSTATVGGSPSFGYGVNLINGNGVYQLSIDPNQNGTGVSAIKVTVTDPSGDVTVKWFYLTINPGNFPPTINPINHTNTLVNTAIVIPVTISDDHTLAGTTLSAHSDNGSLVPDDAIEFSGTGTSRLMTITPANGLTGVAPITVTAHDNDPTGDKTSTTSFTIMVRATTNIVVIDNFDYNDGNLTDVSYGLWSSHSGGGSGPIQVSSGQALIVGANTEDDTIPLIGAPYVTNDTHILYASLKVRFTDLPSVGGAYFAHFRDTNTGAATGFSARIWASTTNAASGFYRLGVANGAGATNTSGQYPMDLALNTDYTVVTRYIPSNGLSTIWINPVNEDGGVTATDQSPIPDTTNTINVVGYCFRQNTASALGNSYEGNLVIENVKVGLTFDEVVGLNVLKIKLDGTNAVVSWTDPAFYLLSATNVLGPYDYEPNTSTPAQTPYVIPATNSAKFFRLTNAPPVSP